MNVCRGIFITVCLACACSSKSTSEPDSAAPPCGDGGPAADAEEEPPSDIGNDAEAGEEPPEAHAVADSQESPQQYWETEYQSTLPRPSSGRGSLVFIPNDVDAGGPEAGRFLCANADAGWVTPYVSCQLPCASGFYISDTQLCIQNLCAPYFALSSEKDLTGVIDLPHLCAPDGGETTIDCDCLPPNVCGSGTCRAVENNTVYCTCPDRPF
jgi:hypothetical protein